MTPISQTIIKSMQYADLLFFYLMNRRRYKWLVFKSRIFRPIVVMGKAHIEIGASVMIKSQSSLFALGDGPEPPILRFETGCSIGNFNHIAAMRHVVIGKHVLTANNVYISDNVHEYEDVNVPIMCQKIRFAGSVVIGEGSWIGENACIIGASVGRNCVIGANAVVTRDIPDYSVAVGAPAKVIKTYNFGTEEWVAVS